MKNLKYLALLIVNLILVGGIYIMCVTSGNPKLLVIMPVYQIIAILAICGYAFLCMRHNNNIGKAKVMGQEIDKEYVRKSKTTLKWYIVAFLPFVMTVLCDYIYLLLLADNPAFQSLIKFIS